MSAEFETPSLSESVSVLSPIPSSSRSSHSSLLNVSASKRLFNDRLTVTVGNNFELEGQNQNTNQSTSLVPGNLAADYQLTPDGRYMVRIYRQNETQDVVQGYVVETGVSFIITVDYNRFRSLFQKRRYDKDGNRVYNNKEESGKTGASN